MGFDKNLFVDSNIINFLCMICQQVCEDPIQCGQCEAIYCQMCIQNHWKDQQNQKQCLKCNQAHDQFQQSRFIKQLILALKVKCKNNECQAQFKLESQESHIQVCEFVLVKCGNQFCQEETIRSKLQEHRNQCSFQLITCKVCENQFFLKDQDNHNCIKSLKQEIVSIKEDLGNFKLEVKKNIDQNFEDIMQFISNSIQNFQSHAKVFQQQDKSNQQIQIQQQQVQQLKKIDVQEKKEQNIKQQPQKNENLDLKSALLTQFPEIQFFIPQAVSQFKCKFSNNGKSAWPKETYLLSLCNLDGSNILVDSVQPNQQIEVDVTYQLPLEEGFYKFSWQLAWNNIFFGDIVQFQVQVVNLFKGQQDKTRIKHSMLYNTLTLDQKVQFSKLKTRTQIKIFYKLAKKGWIQVFNMETIVNHVLFSDGNYELAKKSLKDLADQLGKALPTENAACFTF